MAKKIELNEIAFIINGGGRINEKEPIILEDYVAPAFSDMGAVEIKTTAPKKIRLSKALGKTVYDVVGLFDGGGSLSLLQQFKNLILANS